MLKKEAKAMKERLQDCSLGGFSASDGWLDGWKTAYAIKERRIVDETGDVSKETIISWMEWLQELTSSYSSKNIWNMGESGWFFKALPDKRLVENCKQANGGKKSKQRFTIAFFVIATGKNVEKPVFIWKSGIPRCSRGLWSTRTSQCTLLL